MNARAIAKRTAVESPPAPGGAVVTLLGLGTALAFAVAARGARPHWALYGLFLLLAGTALWALATLPRPTGRVGLVAFLAGVLLMRILTAPVIGVTGAVLAFVATISLALGLTLGERWPRAVPILMAVIVGLGALEAAWVLVQGALAPAPLGSAYQEPPTGTFTNRNHLAGFLNLSLGSALGLLLAGLSRWRRGAPRSEIWGRAWLAVLGIALMALAVLLSRSRGGAASLAVALACGALLNLLWGRRARRTLPVALVALIAVAALGLGLAAGSERLSARFAEIGGSDRPALYRDTLGMIAEHPVGGVGPGMYRWRFRPYQTARLDLWYTHAHNDYLELAAEWGVPMALALWLFVAWRWLGSARRALAAKDSPARGYALGCATAMLAVLVHSLIDFNLHIGANLMAFSLLLGLSWTLAPGVTAPAPAGRSLGGRRGEIVARVTLAMLLTVAAWRVSGLVLAETRLLGARETADLESAIRAAPAAPEPHFRLGLAYRDLPAVSDPARARQHLERAVALNPWSWFYWLELATLEERDGRPRAAEHAMREAVRRNPRSARYRWRLANLLLRAGRTEEALTELRAALSGERQLLEAGWNLMSKLEIPFHDIAAVWPADPDRRLDLLRRAAAAARPADSQGILDEWERLVAGRAPPTVAEGSFLIDHLLRTGALTEARTRWAQLALAAGWRDEAYLSGRNVVWNGEFELPLGSSALAWRVEPPAGGSVGRSPGEGSGDGAGLRVDLPAGSRARGPYVSQLVAADGGRQYTLSCSLRCLRIAATAGFRLEARDSASGRLLAAAGDERCASEWQSYSTRFDLGERPAPIRLALTSHPGSEPAGGGSVWLDGVVLEPSP